MDVNEVDFDVEEENNSEILRISLPKLLKEFKSYKLNNDLQILQKYTDVLMREDSNITEFQEPNYTELLNECIEWVTNYVFHLPLDYTAENITFRELLFLFTVKRLNIVEQENLETKELCLSIINNGCKLVKLCVENDCSTKAEYYMHRIEQELVRLGEFCDKENLQSRQIFQKKIELTLYHIEKMMKEKKAELALEELSRQKENIFGLEKYRDYYVGLCYNISLKFNEVNNYDYSLKGLLLAYDVCKISEHLSEIMKTTLNFFVCICLKYNLHKNWEHAMNALEIANKNRINMFYIIGKIKLALILQQENHLDDILNQAAEWEFIELGSVNKIVKLLQENGLSVKAAEFLRKVRCLPFSINNKFLLTKLEVHLYISENDRRAFSLTENCINMINKNDISKTSIISLYELLVSHASIKFKEKAFIESLNWYTYCMQLCEVGVLDTSLLYQVQLRICLCYLEMNDLKLAKQMFSSLKNSIRISDPLYVYLGLQIAFLDGDETLVEEILIRHNECGNDDEIGNVLLSCCHKALLSGKKEVLIKILETILLKHHTSEESILSVKISQCLIALYAGIKGDKDSQNKYLLYLDKALAILQNNTEHKETAELSQWFSRAAWNLALTPDIEPMYMFEFFLRCCCFSEISPRNFNRLKNSLMLAAASGLHVVRQNMGMDEKSAILKKVLTVIEKCKSLESGANITLLRLLYLYEFEVRCHLNELKNEIGAVKKILHLPIMDIKTLEHIAAIVNEFSPCNYEIIVESLKVAVEKFQADHQRSFDISKTYHCLIQVLFYVQEYLSASVEEENLTLCNLLLQLIENNPNLENYPQLEILWIMTKCWNWGIHKLTLNDRKSANKWCTLAKNFLQKLESLKMLYEQKLNEMYSAYFPDHNEQQNAAQ